MVFLSFYGYDGAIWLAKMIFLDSEIYKELSKYGRSLEYLFSRVNCICELQ